MSSTELVPVTAEIVRRETESFMPALTIEEAIRRKQSIVAFVKQLMVPDTDFGNVPGSSKPTLLKPGAEKLCSYFGLVPRYTAMSVTKDWTGKDHDGEPFFEFDYKCQLVRINDQGSIIGEGDGSCNSWESKYRFREGKRVCPACGKDTIIKGKAEYGGGWLCFAKRGGCGAKYADKDQAIIGQQVGRIPNPDVFDQVNTFEKMAQKRAHVAATLNAVNASEFFSQDYGDPEGDPPPPHWGDSGSQEAADKVAKKTIEALNQGTDFRELRGEDHRDISDETKAIEPPRVPGTEKSRMVTPSTEAKQGKTFSMGKSCEAFAEKKAYAIEKLGEQKALAIYYRVLSINFGVAHANELKQGPVARDCYKMLSAEIEAAIAYAQREQKPDDFDRHVESEITAGR